MGRRTRGSAALSSRARPTRTIFEQRRTRRHPSGDSAPFGEPRGSASARASPPLGADEELPSNLGDGAVRPDHGLAPRACREERPRDRPVFVGASSPDRRPVEVVRAIGPVSSRTPSPSRSSSHARALVRMRARTLEEAAAAALVAEKTEAVLEEQDRARTQRLDRGPAHGARPLRQRRARSFHGPPRRGVGGPRQARRSLGA